MSDNFVIAEMTWTEIEEAAKDRPVAILPVGSTEAHGPHLPVSTDSLIAVEVARRGIAKLRERRISALMLPPLQFSVTEFADSFAGTIGLPADIFASVIIALGLAAGKRFRAFALVNVNLEPQQLDALKRALEGLKKAGVSACCTDLSKKRWADMLGEMFAAGDHAGAFETSLLMAAAPDAVRDSVRRSLAPADGLKEGLKKGAKNFVDAGGEDAYFGDPTAATAEEGEASLEVLSEILALTVLEHLGSKA